MRSARHNVVGKALKRGDSMVPSGDVLEGSKVVGLGIDKFAFRP